jgi:cell division protein FtsZ
MIEIDNNDLFPDVLIKVLGVGGGGGNAIETMIRNKLSKVEFIVANTDLSDLKYSSAKIKIQIGKKITRGRGAGTDPEKGKLAAEESEDEIKKILQGANLLILSAGMGGGTGTGAMPVIAKIAQEMKILTLGIVNTPFKHEGVLRNKRAEEGIRELKKYIDTLLIIPNDKLSLIYKQMTLFDAFQKANDVLYQATKSIVEIINSNGIINVDFADVETTLNNKGFALFGVGEAKLEQDGDNKAKAIEAANSAINNPLLEDITLSSCKGLLINVSTDYNLGMQDYDAIMEVITNEAGGNPNIIQGVVFDEKYKDTVKVSIIATGLHNEQFEQSNEEENVSVMKPSNEDEDFRRIKINTQQRTEKIETEYPRLDDENYEVPAFARKVID